MSVIHIYYNEQPTACRKRLLWFMKCGRQHSFVEPNSHQPPHFPWQHAEQQTMKFMQTPHSLELASSLEMKYQNIYGSVNGCSKFVSLELRTHGTHAFLPTPFQQKRHGTGELHVAKTVQLSPIENGHHARIPQPAHKFALHTMLHHARR